jgi:hypothetical protein
MLASDSGIVAGSLGILRGITGLVPAFTATSDALPAEWLVRRLSRVGTAVDSVVPSGYESYVRIFHPAYIGDRQVRWSEIAERTGRIAHPLMQLWALVRSFGSPEGPITGVFERPPARGECPPEVIHDIVGVLSRHTSTSHFCYYALWCGYASVSFRREVEASAKFETSYRQYHLVNGPLASVQVSLDKRHWQSPNLWWPDDHSWVVGTEVDLDTTYVSCSSDLARELLDLSDIESAMVAHGDPIGIRSDSLNYFRKGPTLS